jgi:hypothetical protein
MHTRHRVAGLSSVHEHLKTSQRPHETKKISTRRAGQRGQRRWLLWYPRAHKLAPIGVREGKVKGGKAARTGLNNEVSADGAVGCRGTPRAHKVEAKPRRYCVAVGAAAPDEAHLSTQKGTCVRAHGRSGVCACMCQCVCCSRPSSLHRDKPVYHAIRFVLFYSFYHSIHPNRSIQTG